MMLMGLITASRSIASKPRSLYVALKSVGASLLAMHSKAMHFPGSARHRLRPSRAGSLLQDGGDL
jgi:hypothetical protein